MAKQCQEQKQLKAQLGQLKAVEREVRRHLETARVQRRHVKQRQISRARGRNHKFDFYWHEDEIGGDLEIISMKQKDAVPHELQGDPWQLIDGQVGEIIAE